MLIRVIAIIAFITSFWGCTKDKEVAIVPFTGNDIDSIVYYQDRTGYTATSAIKYTYSKDKDTITEKWYERIPGSEKLSPYKYEVIPITNNKIILLGTYYDDSCYYTYFLNNSKCIIAHTVTSFNNVLYDSAVYKYDNNNSLESIHEYRYLSAINLFDTFTTKYSWSGGNISQTKYSRKSSIADYNTESYTNFTYTNFLNPLSYYYINNNAHSFMKFGRSNKNLLSSETKYTEFEATSKAYNYALVPSENSYLTNVVPLQNMTYRVFYK